MWIKAVKIIAVVTSGLTFLLFLILAISNFTDRYGNAGAGVSYLISALVFPIIMISFTMMSVGMAEDLRYIRNKTKDD